MNEPLWIINIRHAKNRTESYLNYLKEQSNTDKSFVTDSTEITDKIQEVTNNLHKLEMKLKKAELNYKKWLLNKEFKE